MHCRPNKRELDKISYLIGTYKLLRRDNFSLYLLPLGQIAGNSLLLVGDSGMFHLTFLSFLFQFADHCRYWNRRWLWKVKPSILYRIGNLEKLWVVRPKPFYFWNQCRKEADQTLKDSEFWITPVQSIWSQPRNSSFNVRVVLCRIRLFPTLISKIKWLKGSLWS